MPMVVVGTASVPGPETGIGSGRVALSLERASARGPPVPFPADIPGVNYARVILVRASSLPYSERVFDRLVLGIDPGMAATGLAVVVVRERSGPTVVRAETVRTPAGAAEAGRLRSVHRAVAAILSEHRPEAVALERLMWGRNVGSAMSVARASGVAMLAAAEAGVPVHEYAPLEVKMAVTGDGGARKDDLRRALRRIHRIADVPADSDAADAVAVAVCHLQMARGLRASGAGR